MKRIAALAVWIPLLIAQADRSGVRSVTAVRHWALGDVTRVAVEVSADFHFRTEHLHNPERVYFDIMDSRQRVGPHALYSESLDDKRVKRLRVAESVPGVTRIVLDLAGPLEVSTSQLSNPDRLIIEVRRGPAPAKPEVTEPVPTHSEPPRPDAITPSREMKAILAPDLASAEMVVAEPSKSQLGSSTPVAEAAKPDPAFHDSGAGPGLSAGPVVPAEASKPARRDPPAAWPPAPTSPVNPADSSRSRHDSAAGLPGTSISGGPGETNKTGRHDSMAVPPASSLAASAAPAAGSLSDSGKVAHRESASVLPVPSPAPVNLAETGKPARHTTSGDNSLIRALGLKISRVVIDPGHGGHDQGTQGTRGLLEKDVVLDVGKRVGKLIEEKMGAEVIYTRSDDTFISLEGRTALANEKRADLFLSIHANSSPVTRINGVETYYLNFADTKDAMDVASRENANAQASIFELRDIIQKITLHDKAEESKEFASRIQNSLFTVAAHDFPGTKNRGVKKAPFVVLIGAQMPSILAEIGFLSNQREEALLKRSDYRQKLAEALFRGVQKYADSLSHFQVAQQTQNQP